jgi:hypothetical protein
MISTKINIYDLSVGTIFEYKGKQWIVPNGHSCSCECDTNMVCITTGECDFEYLIDESEIKIISEVKL